MLGPAPFSHGDAHVDIPSFIPPSIMTLFSTLRRLTRTRTDRESFKSAHRALEMPEILELILSHFSQTFLRSSAVLVCRQWNAVAKGLLIQTARWNGREALTEQSRELLLRELESARVLECIESTDLSQELSDDKKFLLARLVDLSKDQKLFLRTLHVGGALNLRTRVVPMLRLMPMLTTLCLESLAKETIPVDEILILCPGLLHLTIKTHWSRLWVDSSRQDYVFNSAEIVHSDASLVLPTLKLQTLALGFICVEERVLETLLRACDTLQELRLIRVLRRRKDDEQIPLGWNSRTMLHWVHLDWFALFLQMGSLCPRLTSLHVTEPNDTFESNPRVEALTQLFPLLTQIGILGDIPSPILLTNIQQHLDALTTLVIANMRQFTFWDSGRVALGDALHAYLCESPHLLHLKAIRTMVDLDRLDVGQISNGSDGYQSLHRDPFKQTSTPHAPQRVWACRQLRTLYLGFIRRGTDLGSSLDTRLIFGYISRVCPELEDVKLCRDKMAPRIHGGLCLLTRLTRLQRLQIQFKDTSDSWLTEQDVNWIVRDAPQSITHRLMQERWIHQMEKGESQRNGTAFAAAIKARDSRGPFVVDGVDFGNLGCLEDVLEVLRDRLKHKWVCWPHLESFEVDYKLDRCFPGSGPGLGLVKLLRKFRPGLKVVPSQGEEYPLPDVLA